MKLKAEDIRGKVIKPSQEPRKYYLVSRVQPFATPWPVARQASLSLELSRQEYWSG